MDKIFSQTGQVKELDIEKGEMTAYVSTKTRDRSDEVLDPEGVDLRNYKKNPVVLWAHDYSMPPIGKALWVKKDGNGVISKFKFASTPFAQEIKTLYKEGILNAFSVGFVPKEHEDVDGEKKPRRTYKKWEMLEFSAVPVPANPDALSLAMSKGLINTPELKKALGIDQPLQEFNNEEKETEQETVEEVAEPLPVHGAGLEDLMADNALLRETNESLQTEVEGLRVKYFELLTKTQQKQSEMLADDFVNKFEEIVSRGIRKAQGKLD